MELEEKDDADKAYINNGRICPENPLPSCELGYGTPKNMSTYASNSPVESHILAPFPEWTMSVMSI